MSRRKRDVNFTSSDVDAQDAQDVKKRSGNVAGGSENVLNRDCLPSIYCQHVQDASIAATATVSSKDLN